MSNLSSPITQSKNRIKEGINYKKNSISFLSFSFIFNIIIIKSFILIIDDLYVILKYSPSTSFLFFHFIFFHFKLPITDIAKIILFSKILIFKSHSTLLTYEIKIYELLILVSFTLIIYF